MLDLVFVILLGVWSAGLGHWVLSRFGGRPRHAVDALALAVPLGLGCLALACLGLGESGMLDRRGMSVILAVGVWMGCVEWFAIVRRVRATRENMDERTRADGTPRTPLDWVFDGALVATLAGTLLTALAPVTDGDALCYHLQVPKVFLTAGCVGFDPDLHETVYPLITEMLYAAGLAFRGPVACRLIQWLLGLVFAANVAALARPVLGSRARWAGTIALLVPAVSNGMGAPLNDVALAAFGNAALGAWMRWRERRTFGSAALAGILAGLAIGVKYPALVWVAQLGLLTMLSTSLLTPSYAPCGNVFLAALRPESEERRRASETALPRRARARGTLANVAVFGLVAALTGGCWYLRAYVHTGNPVYPFFRHAFGGAGIDDVLDPIKRPMAPTPLSLATALGPMTLQPDRFDSVSHQFGPAFLLFLPGLMLSRPPRRVVGITALGFAFLTLCLTQRQSTRFVLTAVGPFSIAVGWLANHWAERRTIAARALLGVLVLMLGFESALAVLRARHGISVVMGRESAESYLARREPTYRVGRWVGGHLPASARIVGQDHRGFYIPRAYAMELAHRRRTGLGRRGESAAEIVRRLRIEGFTHLLLCAPVPEDAVEFDPTLSRRLAPWLASQQPLYAEEITDPDRVVRRYAIYALVPESSLADGGRSRR